MIRVFDDYAIRIEEKCYAAVVVTGKFDKKGNEIFKTIGYFGTLKDALREIVNYDYKNNLANKDVDLKEALSEMNVSINKLEALLQTIREV